MEGREIDEWVILRSKVGKSDGSYVGMSRWPKRCACLWYPHAVDGVAASAFPTRNRLQTGTRPAATTDCKKTPRRGRADQFSMCFTQHRRRKRHNLHLSSTRGSHLLLQSPSKPHRRFYRPARQTSTGSTRRCCSMWQGSSMFRFWIPRHPDCAAAQPTPKLPKVCNPGDRIVAPPCRTYPSPIGHLL